MANRLAEELDASTRICRSNSFGRLENVRIIAVTAEAFPLAFECQLSEHKSSAWAAYVVVCLGARRLCGLQLCGNVRGCGMGDRQD
jgi:hypothetical protein